MRREILKLDEKESDLLDTSATVLIDELPEEKQLAKDATDGAFPEEPTDKQKARSVILQGAIPRIIYNNAIASITDGGVAFRLKFIEISDLFGHKFAADLSQFILDACLRDFADSELMHVAQALRPFAVEADERIAEQRAVQSFEASVASLKSVLMQEKFAEWLVSRLATGAAKSEFLVEYATKKLKELAKASSANGVKYVDFVQRTEGTSAALDAVKGLLQKPQLARAAQLWLLYAQLVLHVDDSKSSVSSPLKPATKRRRTSADNNSKAHSSNSKNASVAECIAILEDAVSFKLEESDYEGKFALSTRLLHILIGGSGDASSSSKIEATFQVQSTSFIFVLFVISSHAILTCNLSMILPCPTC